MFKNHLKIALRQLARNKVFSTLNILGLSLGMALAILIAIFIKSELSYDVWMADSENTYRVYRIKEGNTAWTPPQLANKLVTDYPEVAAATGFRSSGERLISFKGEDAYIKETAEVDSSFFNVLGMDFVYGDPLKALDQPNAMVISDQLSTRLFGAENPIGKIIKYDGNQDFMITGVIDRAGKKSHIISDIFTRFRWYGNSWAGNNRATYVRLKPNANPKALISKVDKEVSKLIEQEYLAKNYTPTKSDFYKWALQPLSQVHLHSKGFTSITHVKGSIRNVYIFALIALLVLIVAIINYVNLTTARSAQRSKEIGVKKVAGAGRTMLTRQFITESIVQAAIAAIFALLIAEICLPFFNKITDRELVLFGGEVFSIVIGTVSLAILVGLVAGIYPAFVMSAFTPVTALKSNFLKTGNKGMFRKVLVTTQFAVSISLLIIMTFIYKQVNYMMDKDLGFQPNQVLTIPMTVEGSYLKVDQLKAQFKQIPGVQAITTASTFPGGFFPDWSMLIEGKTENVVPYTIFSDGDYADMLDIEMIEGRFLDNNIQADQSSNFVVNEQFVKEYNIKNPIGTKVKFDWQTEYGQIVGVMKDFHYRDLGRKIDPLVMNSNDWRSFVGVKLSTKDLAATIASLKEIWTSIEPTHPMRYSFLDQEFAKQYADQKRFGQSILYATFLTLFIALLGLFGLTAFTVERRTKEIGIRKVLGASVAGIVGLLAKDFGKLIVFASLIAIPLSYMLSKQWLADFAHRIDMVWWVFVGSGLVILAIGFLIVALQSMRAALSNPVKSLRSE